MVGVPRSNGCRVCLKRKVKCDEERPACARCRTYGVDCPGYEKALKFVKQKQHRAQMPSSPVQAHVELPRSTASPMPLFGATSSTRGLTHKVLLQSPRNFRGSVEPTIPCPGIYQVQCLSRWIEDISKSPSDVSDEITVARWFVSIPARLGTSSALDMAVRCLTVHHLGITQNSKDAIRYARLAYGKALSSLQRALDDPAEVLASTTLCATMILCFYELFACTKADAWMKHVDGVGRLIRLRGIEGFRDAFDSTMLMAFKGLIIMEALYSGKCCFLDSEPWRSLQLQPEDDSIPAQFYMKTEEFGRCLAVCPGLVREVYVIFTRGKLATKAQISVLAQRCIEIYNRLQTWYEDFTAFCPPPYEVPSVFGDPLFPVSLHYCNSFSATVFCGYYAMVIILCKILAEFKYQGDYTNNISAAVENICKSVEFLYGSGILGPYRLGFSLRIAFEAASKDTKCWILKWVERFESFYGSAGSKNYPTI